MSLRDQIVAESQIPKGPECSVKILLNELSDDDADALREALATPKVTGTAIERALLKEGYRMGAHNLQRHRRGACGCES